VEPAKFGRETEPLVGLYNDYGGLALLWDFSYDNRTHSFVVDGIPPGSYELGVAEGLDRPEVRQRFVVTESDVERLVLTMQPSLNLHADVHLPEGFHPTTSYSVLLSVHRDGESFEEVGWPVNPKGQTLLPIRTTGHYRVSLFGKDPLYLKSAFLGGREVLDDGFYLTETSAIPLTVTLGVATGTIAGKVMRSRTEPANKADVKLIAQGVDAPFVLMSAMSDQQGRFHFAAVPPGDYEIVAIDQIVRNRAFGPLELTNVKRWSKPVNVGTVNPAGVELDLATMRYVEAGCAPGNSLLSAP